MCRQSWGKWYLRNDKGDLIPAPPENHDHGKSKRIFKEAFNSTKFAAQAALSRRVVVGSVSYPDHLNRSSFHSMYESMSESEVSLDR
jgi:hypothetical protein